MSLQVKAESGFYWATLDGIGSQGLQFVIQIILARILMPEDFAAMAILLVVILFANMLIDSGLGIALIQTKTLTPAMASTVFFFNLALAIVAMITIYLIAPYVARFYQTPSLTELIRVSAFLLPIRSLGLVQNFILRREMKFRRLFTISLPSILLSGCCAIVFAIIGFGVWALVVQQLVNQALRNFLYLFSTERQWRPQLKLVNLRELIPLLNFSLPLLVARLVLEVDQNISTLVIGKSFPIAELGFFQRARSFQQLPIRTFTRILDQVLFPIFAVIQDDDKRIRRALKKTLPAVAFIAIGGMAMLITTSENLVITLLTKKWEGAVAYTRIFALVGIIVPFTVVFAGILRAKGRTVLVMTLNIASNIFSISMLFILLPFGIQAIIFGLVAKTFVRLLLNLFWVQRLVGYTMFSFFRNILPTTILALFVACLTVAVDMASTLDHALTLALQVLLFSSAYIGLAKLFRLQGFVVSQEQILKAFYRTAFRWKKSATPTS